MKLGLVFLAIALSGCAATTETTSVSEPATTTNPYANFNLTSEHGNAEMQTSTPLPEVGASMRQSKDAAFKQYQQNQTPENKHNYEQSLKAYDDYMRAHRQYIDYTDITPWDLQ